MSFAKTKWIETTKANPCPCGSHGYCSVSEDGSVYQCRKGLESPSRVKQKDGSYAYLHLAGGAMRLDARVPVGRAKPDVGKLTAAELKTIVKRQQTALTTRRLDVAARSMKLTPHALATYGAGWDDEARALSFPMYDGTQKPIGIRLRCEDGKKRCVVGSSNGLFVPVGFDAKTPPADLSDLDPNYATLLLTPEGPTDCAAATMVGFRAVGRPSCNGGGDMLATLLMRCRNLGNPQHVVIVADRDPTKWHKGPDGNPTFPYWPGWEGALATAHAVRASCASLKVIKPPSGHKDLRDMVAGMDVDPHLLGAALRTWIDTTEEATADWIDAQLALVNEWRQGLAETKRRQLKGVA